MKVKLYSAVRKNEEKIFDRVSGKTIMLSPEDKPEELLGEFNAAHMTAPNGSEWIVVNTPKGRIKFRKGQLTRETEVNTFRIETVGR